MAGIGPLSPQLDAVGVLSFERLWVRAVDEFEEFDEFEEVIFQLKMSKKVLCDCD